MNKDLKITSIKTKKLVLRKNKLFKGIIYKKSSSVTLLGLTAEQRLSIFEILTLWSAKRGRAPIGALY